jgi:hypothetical protein
MKKGKATLGQFASCWTDRIIERIGLKGLGWELANDPRNTELFGGWSIWERRKSVSHAHFGLSIDSVGKYAMHYACLADG